MDHRNKFKYFSTFIYYFESFLLVGPSLIGWLIGILFYTPADIKFKLTFQSGMIFILYCVLFTINALLAFFDVGGRAGGGGYLEYSHFVASFLVILYLLFSTIAFIFYINQKSIFFPIFHRILDKLLSK